MSEIVYLNGRWVERDRATVSVEDRGFLFADGVYETLRYYNGRALALDRHVRRMKHSLSEIRLAMPPESPPLGELSDELVRRNRLRDAKVYWQVTRGVAPRHHAFPSESTSPTVLMMTYPAGPLDREGPVESLRAITRPDVRWQRCSIKSIALLPNVLDNQAAADAGCDEAILADDGVITEGTKNSIFIVEDGVLLTHPLDGRILPSITRELVIELAEQLGLRTREEYFYTDRLYDADEVLAVGSTTEIASIVQIDGRAVAEGKPGPTAERLLEAYRQRVIQECGVQPEGG